MCIRDSYRSVSSLLINFTDFTLITPETAHILLALLWVSTYVSIREAATVSENGEEMQSCSTIRLRNWTKDKRYTKQTWEQCPNEIPSTVLTKCINRNENYTNVKTKSKERVATRFFNSRWWGSRDIHVNNQSPRHCCVTLLPYIIVWRVVAYYSFTHSYTIAYCARMNTRNNWIFKRANIIHISNKIHTFANDYWTVKSFVRATI